MVNADRIGAIKSANPDLIVLMGGTNDTHLGVSFGEESQLTVPLEDKDKTTFYGAYSFLIETLLTWKPNLEIILMTPMDSNWDVANNYGDYAKAIRKIADHYSIPVADTNKDGTMISDDFATYTEDGLHPNAQGGWVIANIVAKQINEIYSLD